MNLLSKEQILSANDLKTEIVDVPEWGGQVRISMMTGLARDRFETSCVGKNGGENLVNIRAKMVAACAVDEKGYLLFTEKEVTKLGNKSGAVLDRLFDTAQKLNKITDTDVEELAKN